MEAADMETENELPSPSSSSSSSPSSKRFAVKHTVQTNFGDDYVFQIASSQEVSALAVSLSSNVVKLYSPETGQYYGECKGHSQRINEISFSMPSSVHVMWSCSSDGSIRAWDTRTFKQVSLLQAGSLEIYSFGIGGSSAHLLAAGCNTQILFWDLRNGKQVSSLEESHMDDVTQVRYAPNQHNKLVSSSVDGLLCVYDTEGHINDDEHLESVMNVGTSIAKIGFFGEMNQKLWCLTHIETLSVWDWQNGKERVNFQDARSSASGHWNLDQVDYFVDCLYSGEEDRLWVVGGTDDGTLGYFPVSDSPGAVGPVEAILEGGHTGIVRTILPICSAHGSVARNKSIFGWTGGEDGRLCCWLSDETSQSRESWISRALTTRSSRFHKSIRHHPY